VPRPPAPARRTKKSHKNSFLLVHHAIPATIPSRKTRLLLRSPFAKWGILQISNVSFADGSAEQTNSFC